MSKNTQRLLIILVLAIVFCIIGGAVAIGALGLAANSLKDNFADDPDKAHAMASKFISYDLPQDYSETIGLDFFLYQMILINETGYFRSRPMIVVTNFTTTQGMTPEQMTQQMQSSLEQNGGQKLTLKETETRDVTIDGQAATLIVKEGTDQDGEDFKQWVTSFEGKSGYVILIIQGPTDQWDDATFNDFLESIVTK